MKMEYYQCKVYDAEVNKLVTGLRVADCMVLSHADDCMETLDRDITAKIQDLTISNVLNCSYCNIAFSDATEQRSHFKLDWHRYNLKRALCDKPYVAEDVFDGLADDVSSISGSESESSHKDDSDSENNDLSEKKAVNKKFIRGRHSKAFFENGENKIFSVYKCLLYSKKDNITNSSLISSMSNMLNGPKKWLIVMLGGGHFAAAIFNNGVIAEHKTFHCYTVRAKQGGSQSSRDNKGGGHPKSAGASLRRYNEQALVQHVQEIMGIWADSLKQCELILYRATGRYNRGVLFGGKNPPLEKSDPRLRNIPFPTRRATFKEVNRVHDVLSTVEVYGSSSEFKDKYPRSPDNRSSPRRVSTRPNDTLQEILENVKHTEPKVTKKKTTPRKIDRSKARSSPEREIPGENLRSSESGSCDGEEGEDLLISSYATIQLEELQEFDDDVPAHMKDPQNEGKRNKEGSISSRRKRKKATKSALERKFEAIHKKLVTCCENEDVELLKKTLEICDTLPEEYDEDDTSEKGTVMTKKNFINCINSCLNSENKNTVLHLAALKSLPEFITILLEAGADPTIRNKNRLTPYVLSGNKETRNSFKEFVSSYPDRIDCKKALIPEPPTEEMQRVNDEKKREKNRLKRQKDKIKKKENKEKIEEEREKKRFLALSDREKCALAAERRMLASATANMKSAKPPVLSRCFLCGVDITGKVPFEYGTNRFCSVPCVKAHRLKTNSYGVEI